MPLPNFMMFGVPKSGSSSLHGYLRQHPQVFLPAVKEPDFFRTDDEAIEKRPGGPPVSLTRVRTWKEYEGLYSRVRDEKAIGDMSVCTYRGGRRAAEAIRSSLPDVRLFAIIRQPAERAYSSYLHLRRTGVEPCATFEEALAAEPERLKAGRRPDWGYARDGYYRDRFHEFFECFPPGNARVFLYDDWARPEALLRDLFRFLGVDPEAPIALGRRENIGGMPRHPWMHRPQPRAVRLAIRLLLPPAGRAWLKSRIGRIRRLDLGAAPPIDPGTRAWLTRRYRDDILATQELIGRDLSHWLA
jgi:hypothetical protein